MRLRCFRLARGGNQSITRVRAHQIISTAFEANEMEGQLGTHSMRKTFANRIYDKLEGDLPKTQRALGHKNINSTVSYLSFEEAGMKLDDEFYTTKELAELFKVSTKTIERAVKSGKLKIHKIEGSNRFRTKDIEAYLKTVVE